MISGEAEIPTFKCVLLGDDRTGKTTFVKRHLNPDEFVMRYEPTLGVYVYTLDFHTTRGSLRFNVWDTAGKDENRGLSDCYYINAHCAIVMFDVSSSETLRHAFKWYRDLMRVCPDIPVVLCGNKADKRSEVSLWGSPLFHKRNVRFVQISTKSKYNLGQPFLWLARQMLGHKLALKDMPHLATGMTNCGSELMARRQLRSYGPRIERLAEDYQESQIMDVSV